MTRSGKITKGKGTLPVRGVLGASPNEFLSLNYRVHNIPVEYKYCSHGTGRRLQTLGNGLRASPAALMTGCKHLYSLISDKAIYI